MNNKIQGVVIDPGHGGDDPGAVNGNIYEKDFSLEVSKYIYDRLNKLGIPTYITRTTDETLNRDERVRRILSAFGNSSDVIVLSNHINAGGGEGAEVVYALRNSDALAKQVLDSIGNEGQIKRKYYQRRLPSDPSKDYYFIQRLTGNTQPLLIEYGFIDNPKDLKKLQDNIIKYGEAVVKAVANYLNIPYQLPSGVTGNTYVVQRGDTLYSIANKFNTTVSELKAVNNITSNLLQLGQQLIIPTIPEAPSANEYIKYTVQKGDTLYNIAKEFNTSVDNLINYNQLASSSLSIGQQLLIPMETDEVIIVDDYYVVQPGDSLYGIAKKYNTTVSEIIKLNNLKTTILQVNDKLIIPNYSDIKDNDEKTEEEINNNNTIYTVQSGDSLYSISKKFGISIDSIKKENNLSSNLLSIGQELIIPVESNNQTYYVQSGDSLYSIAMKYNTTVDEIKRLNSLTSNLLKIGQVLLIP